MNRILGLFVLLAALIACRGDSQEAENVVKMNTDLNGHTLVVFIEEHTRGEGTGAGDFGDVVLIDLVDGQKRYVTRDKEADEQPAISPDGKQVLFVSMRGRSDAQREMLGLTGARRLYRFDLTNGTLTPFASGIQRAHLSDMIHFTGLAWSANGDAVFYTEWKNRIYALSETGNSLSTLIDIDGVGQIIDLSPSPGGRYLAFSFYGDEPKLNGAGLLDLKTHSVRMFLPPGRAAYVGGWSTDGNRLLIKSMDFPDDSFLLFDTQTWTYQSVKIPGEGVTLSTRTGYFDSADNLIFLARRITDASNVRTPTMDLARFNVRDSVLEWLTQDGYNKTTLRAVTVRK